MGIGGPATELQEAKIPPTEVIWGSTAAMALVHRKLDALADTTVPVLLQGESGTGKEIIAKLVHETSPYRNGAFVKVNCPAIPGTLIESELFGFERGAFTGAIRTKPGRVEMADHGTLFLDEIGELDPTLQAKLLTLLQDGMFSRIGGQEQKRIETRLVSATNRVLLEEVAVGTFRQDLYHRINVVQLYLPALRHRLEDLPMLVDYFLSVYNDKFNRRTKPFSKRAMRMLHDYPWPGNIRELENLIRRYAILGDEDASLIELFNRGESISEDIQIEEIMPLKQLTKKAMQQVERQVILKVLQANNWNRKKAAKVLDISYRALLYKIREAGLPPARAYTVNHHVDAGSGEIN